ncbi:MAG: serpin family protein [Isosphaera sp.]|nr:serpin family protein [Isosphaera sp.]
MHPSPVTRRRFLAASAALAAGGLAPRPAARACGDAPPPDPAKDMAAAVNAFGLDLQAKLAGENGGLFFSPLSVSAALAMTSAGAAGETLAEMTKVLRLPADPHPAYGDLLHRLNRTGPYAVRCPRKYELAVANAIWAHADFPWRKEFADFTRKHYGTGPEEVDFGEPEAARKRVNDWAEKQTRDRIKELLPAGVVTPLTRMVLANAVYFKGDWATRFDPKRTREEPFTTADGSAAKAPLMHLAGDFRYAEFKLAGHPPRKVGPAPEYPVQALELPYAGRELSMVLFLPRDPRSVRAVAGLLTPAHLAPDGLAWREREVDVTLPRFKVETGYSLNKPLKDLGMKAAFGPADFTGMSPRGRELSVTDVLHKAFVEVTEEGSEAAGATGVVIGRASAPPDPVEFRADRPFVFAIRENATGAALFLGRYDGPTR